MLDGLSPTWIWRYTGLLSNSTALNGHENINSSFLPRNHKACGFLVPSRRPTLMHWARAAVSWAPLGYDYCRTLHHHSRCRNISVLIFYNFAGFFSLVKSYAEHTHRGLHKHGLSHHKRNIECYEMQLCGIVFSMTITYDFTIIVMWRILALTSFSSVHIFLPRGHMIEHNRKT